MREWKIQEWKMLQQIAGVKNAAAIMHGKLSDENTMILVVM